MSANHGLSTEAEIQDSILSNLPVAFGEALAIDPAVLTAKYYEFLDSASAASAPFLGPDTIRYQTILLTLSLFLIATSAFRLAVVKLFDVDVPAGGKFFLLYSALIVAVEVIFAVKAFLDSQRAAYVRMKQRNVQNEYLALLSLGLDLTHIQDHFWFEISNALASAFALQSSFLEAVLSSATPALATGEPVNAFPLDRTSMRKIPKAKEEIRRLDFYKKWFCEGLERDKANFRKEAEAIVEAWKKLDRNDPEVILRDHSFDKIEEAYQRHLRMYTAVREELLDRKLDAVEARARYNEEDGRAQEIIAVLRRNSRIQNVYAACEIAAPVLFAAASILLVALR